MTGDRTEILLIERLGGSDDRVSFSARCHVGTLRVGATLTTATDPHGGTHEIRVECVEIRLNEGLDVTALETNFGGLVVLEGPDARSLDHDWTLSDQQ
jgi:hypothetical protein